MRSKIGVITAVALLAFASAGSLFAQRRALILPDNTDLIIRLTDTLDSGRNQTGDQFEAVVDQDYVADGRVQIPVGSQVVGLLGRWAVRRRVPCKRKWAARGLARNRAGSAKRCQ